jgi:hypothetical protein
MPYYVEALQLIDGNSIEFAVLVAAQLSKWRCLFLPPRLLPNHHGRIPPPKRLLRS